jgi:hypothetical protein
MTLFETLSNFFFPDGSEGVMRRRWRKNIGGRWHWRRRVHAADVQISVWWSLDFIWSPCFVNVDDHMYTQFRFAQNLTGARPTGTQLLSKSGDVCVPGFFCWNWGRSLKYLFALADIRGCELNRGALEYKAGMLPVGPQCSVDLKVVAFDSWGWFFFLLPWIYKCLELHCWIVLPSMV